MIGIYAISCGTKLYIGQSKNIESRIRKHFQELRRGVHHNTKLQNSFNFYGETRFSWRIVCECPEDRLDELETWYIKKFDTVSGGFNLEYGGNRSKKLSEETKCKIAMAITGKKHTEESKEKIRLANLGRKRGGVFTEERRRAQSEFMKGKKMRLGKTGNKMSLETRQKMSLSKLGNQNAKGSKRTPEEIINIIENNKKNAGKKYNHSDSYYIKRGLSIPHK